MTRSNNGLNIALWITAMWKVAVPIADLAGCALLVAMEILVFVARREVPIAR